MSLALFADKLDQALKKRVDDLPGAIIDFKNLSKLASEKLGQFHLATCACMLAQAAVLLDSGDTQEFRALTNKISLNLDGVLDANVDSLKLFARQAKSSVDDLDGFELSASDIITLNSYQIESPQVCRLAVQFACQLFKTKVLFERLAQPEDLAVVSSILTQNNFPLSKFYEALITIACGEPKSAQLLLEELLLELEDSQAAAEVVLLPMLALAYCYLVQDKASSAATYIYWATDLAESSFTKGSEEHIDLLTYAAYFAQLEGDSDTAQKYFQSIIAAAADTAYPEVILALLELQKDAPELESACQSIFNQPWPTDIKWNNPNEEPVGETAQKILQSLLSLKARYQTELSPRLLLGVAQLQQKCTVENLIEMAQQILKSKT